jgi:hypothetical protein
VSEKLLPNDGGPVDAMSEEQMLGPWFKEFADLGHWFDSAHGKCIRCGAATIDIYEDGVYGETRPCRAQPESPQQ